MTLHLSRRLGAIALLAVGAVHLEQYFGADYRAIPTIGPLFLLNAIASGIVAIALLAPLERIVPAPRRGIAIGLSASAGVAIALGSLVALFISESASLFGFSESGYRTAIVLSIVAEVAAIALLAPVAAVSLMRAGSSRGGHRSSRQALGA